MNKIPQIGNLVMMRYFDPYRHNGPVGVPFYGIIFAVEKLNEDIVICAWILKANHSHCHIWNKFDEVLS